MYPTPTYSVIIPHYNSPALLKRCLASIPEREEIQVIVVDDNSSEKKVDFNNFPGTERKYTEIIYNKESHGAGNARNLALAKAKGKWLLFSDADDFFTKDAWQIIEQHEQSESDIVYFGVTSVDSDTLTPTDRYKTYDKHVQLFVNSPTKDNEKWLRYRHDVPWGKMIKHTLVTNYSIQFDTTRFCNDTIFSTLTAIYATSIEADSRAIYCVTDCTNSLTRHQSADAHIIRFEVILRKNELLRKHHVAKYQVSILYFFREALENKYSASTIIKMICLSCKYRANFFIRNQ